MNKAEHLLTCLIEECAEVQQAATKALRFGLDDGHPEGTATNEQDLMKEISHFTAVAELLQEENILTLPMFSGPEYNAKKERVRAYMSYAARRGTLKP